MRWTCSGCGATIRYSGREGTRAVRCGRCKQPVPTPGIVKRVTDLNARLEAILHRIQRARALGPTAVDELEVQIAKERAVMRNMAAAYPGWMQTNNAYEEIFVETEWHLIRLEQAIKRTAIRRLQRAIELLRDLWAPIRILQIAAGAG